MGVGDIDMPEVDDTEEQITSEGEVQTEEEQEMWDKHVGFKGRKTKRKFYPTVAARKSSRGKSTPTRMAITTESQGMLDTPSNSFSVLNSCSDDLLEEIAVNCDVILGTNREEVLETLSAMKLEEQARAALAEANYNRHLEEKLTDQHVLEGECTDLQVIDNTHRGVEGETDKDNDSRGAVMREDSEASTSQAEGDIVTNKKGGKKSSKGKEKGSRLSRELRRISYQ
ncbi:unnamed protein product [Urochloa humidicola]